MDTMKIDNVPEVPTHEQVDVGQCRCCNMKGVNQRRVLQYSGINICIRQVYHLVIEWKHGVKQRAKLIEQGLNVTGRSLQFVGDSGRHDG